MNNNNQSISTSAKAVLAKITKGEILMRSKWQFIWRAIAVATVTLLAFLVTSFVVSFIIFASKASGHGFLLAFGGSGWRTFLTLFPWKLLVLAIILFFALRLLLREFRWGYRNSFLFVFGAVTLSSIVAGTLVSATSLHPMLLEKADRDELPLLKGVYESIREPLREHQHGVYKGTITATFDGGFMLEHDDRDSDTDDGIVTVQLPDNEQQTFSLGDTVFVAGDQEDDGSIQAYGIQRIDLSGPVPKRTYKK